MRRILWVFLLAGCSESLERVCTVDADCLQDDQGGHCLPTPAASGNKWCAFTGSSCPSGQRWGLLAGDGLANQCVALTGGPDGGAGDAPARDGGAGDAAVADAGPMPIKTYTLTIIPAGTGAGTVTSSPEGISCGSTCTAQIVAGQSVLLNTTAGPHDIFAGWSGGGCTGTSSCLVPVNGPITVTASFTRLYTLTVSVVGRLDGSRVTSTPSGIDCLDTSGGSGTSCEHDFLPGTSISLSQVPGSGLLFGGWANACIPPTAHTDEEFLEASTASHCVFTISSSSTSAVALFGEPITLTVTVNGNAKVNSIPLSPAGSHSIDCQGPGTCGASFSFLGFVGFQSSIGVTWTGETPVSGCGSASKFCEVGTQGFIGFITAQTITVTP